LAEIKENVIEWITGDKEIACTFTQRKFIHKIQKLRERQPKIVTHFVENKDGSIFCHLPLKALKLYLISPKEEGVSEIEEEDDEIDEEEDK